MFLPLIYSLALSIFWLPDSPLGFQKGLALCLRCQRLVVVVKIQREGLVERSRRSYHQEQHQRKCSFLAQGPPRRHHFGLGHFWGHRLSLLRLQLSLSLSLSHWLCLLLTHSRWTTTKMTNWKWFVWCAMNSTWRCSRQWTHDEFLTQMMREDQRFLEDTFNVARKK